ncbi:hypothetical protein UFOVP115_56 [uncultured Caudovirales phage]|uniref:Uncharacterized protein n=1 Tax=uncultured Caudovirales phage TaxID=2100421 RepID=A0A6J5L5B2_9CAUD|nr:hypothetical protein UFOVP115_56 [uncultured Caudovirales phage]
MKEPEHPGFTILPLMDQRFKDGITYGTVAEQSRIIKLLEDAQVTEAELFDGRTIKVKCESVRADLLIALIKDPTRDITSEILPDGSIYIEEIKGEGENK